MGTDIGTNQSIRATIFGEWFNLPPALRLTDGNSSFFVGATEAAIDTALNFLHVERNSILGPRPTTWVKNVTPFKMTYRELEESASDILTGFTDYKDFFGTSDLIVRYCVYVQVGFLDRWVCVSDRGWVVLVTSIPEG